MENFQNVKESLVVEMENVLGDRGYPYRNSAIEKIIEEWAH